MNGPRLTTLNELKKAISTVVDYDWDTEMEDYQEHRSEMDEPEAHVFYTLVALNNWVHGADQDPDKLVGYEENENE